MTTVCHDVLHPLLSISDPVSMTVLELLIVFSVSVNGHHVVITVTMLSKVKVLNDTCAGEVVTVFLSPVFVVMGTQVVVGCSSSELWEDPSSVETLE